MFLFSSESQRMSGQAIVISPNTEIIQTSGVARALEEIRPEWQARNLIHRVQRLLPVDPSSACQRLFNASIHDLREKVIVAGLDIAKEAANQHKLPTVEKSEDVENYSVSRVLDLAYRMGILSRPDWRRMLRVYDIRKDLEHEDDEYEAEIQDCVYVFTTCIDVVLSKDAVQLIKLTDIKEIVEQPSPTTLTDSVLTEYGHAPEPRQIEISKLLISYSLDPKQSDIVRQNCYNAILSLQSLTHKGVKLAMAENMVSRIKRNVPDLAQIRVSLGAGILPYLKKTQLKAFFSEYYGSMKNVSYRWTQHSRHGELLRNLEEVGGIEFCPDELMDDFLEWLVMCFIGEPGGYGRMGSNRRVFYSDVGAPIALRILQSATKLEFARLERLRKKSGLVRTACQNEFVQRRFERILDVVAE